MVKTFQFWKEEGISRSAISDNWDLTLLGIEFFRNTK